MKILAVSDKVDELLYSPAIKHLFADVDLVLGCGDLPFHYLEFLVTMLPVYHIFTVQSGKNSGFNYAYC